MHKIFSDEHKIVILADSRSLATDLAANIKDDRSFYDFLKNDNRSIYVLYPPFTNAQLEILLEAMLANCRDPESDTAALLDNIETLMGILSYVRESGSLTLEEFSPTSEE